MSSGFKVCVEPLATVRIKQINYEGEEIYQELVTNNQLVMIVYFAVLFAVANRHRHRR